MSPPWLEPADLSPSPTVPFGSTPATGESYSEVRAHQLRRRQFEHDYRGKSLTICKTHRCSKSHGLTTDVHGIVSANPYVQTNRQTPEMMSRDSCIYIDRVPIAEFIHLDFQIKRSFCTCASVFRSDVCFLFFQFEWENAGLSCGFLKKQTLCIACTL